MINGTYSGQLQSYRHVDTGSFQDAGGSYNTYTRMEVGDSINYGSSGPGVYTYIKEDGTTGNLQVRMNIVEATNLDYINPTDNGDGMTIQYKSADPSNSVKLEYTFLDADTGEEVNLANGQFAMIDVDETDWLTAGGDSGDVLQLHAYMRDGLGAWGTNYDYTAANGELTLVGVNAANRQLSSGGPDFIGTSWTEGRTSVSFTMGTTAARMTMGFRSRDQGEPIAVCFAQGTKITTQRGAVAIEKLVAGDMILTKDNGLQPIRWVGSREVSAAELAKAPQLRPIRINAGALGVQLPATDLVVSPQHRILIRSKIAQRMFGTDEVLVAAKQLLDIDGIEIAEDIATVEYFHILFDRHEIVFANGTEAESLYTGVEALRGVGEKAREEIFALFPKLRDYNGKEPLPAARILAPGRMARQLASRHAKNERKLFTL